MRSRGALAVAAALLLVGAVGAHAAEKDKDEDNPHEKMTRSRSVCIDCHTRVPKPGEHAADYSLVDAPSENCLGCHSESEHAGARAHLGREFAKEAPEVAAGLPLDEHGKIACFTCHDPHPAGVIEGRTVHASAVNTETRTFLAARALPAGAERLEPSAEFGALLRLPPGVGCAGCHPATKESPWREKTLWSERIRVLPYW